MEKPLSENALRRIFSLNQGEFVFRNGQGRKVKINMKKKILVYGFISVFALTVFWGVKTVSARGFGGGFGMFGGGLSSDQIANRAQEMFQNEAQILGISVDELKVEWAAGKSFPEIIRDRGISQSDVQARLKDLRVKQLKSQLQVLIDKGVITQAQADSRFQAVQNRADKMEKEGRRGGGMTMKGFMF